MSIIDINDLFEPKKDLEDEWGELGVLIHEVLDNGTPVNDVHEYVDMIFQGNQNLMLIELTNGRFND